MEQAGTTFGSHPPKESPHSALWTKHEIPASRSVLALTPPKELGDLMSTHCERQGNKCNATQKTTMQALSLHQTCPPHVKQHM